MIPILAIVILDLPALRRRLLRMMYNITGDEKYNRKRKTKKSASKNVRDAEEPQKRRERRGRVGLQAEVDAVTEVSEV